MWGQSPSVGERVCRGWGFFPPPFSTMGLFQEIWSPNLRLQNWYHLEITKNFRSVPKLGFWVLKIICNRHEGDVCMGRWYYESAVELLLWLLCPRCKGQELGFTRWVSLPGPSSSTVPGVPVTARIWGGSEASCLLIIVQESWAAPWPLLPVALHQRTLVSLRALTWKRVQRSKWSSSVEGDLFYSE